MKAFLNDITSKFKKELFLMIAILVVQAIVSSASVVSVAPLVDLFSNPDLQKASSLTLNLVEKLNSYGLSTNLEDFLIYFILATVLKNILFLTIRYLTISIKYKVQYRLVSEALTSLYLAKWKFFTQSSQGSILNSFLRESQIVGDCFGQLGLLWLNGTQIVIFLIIPLVISWKTTLICFVIASLFTIPFFLLGRINYKFGKLNVSTGNLMTGTIKELLDGAKIIMGYGNQSLAGERYHQSFLANYSVTVKSQTLNTAMPLFFEPLALIALFSTLFTGKQFGIPLAELVVVVLGLKNVLPEIGSFVSGYNILKGSLPSYYQLKSFKENADAMKVKSGEIKFESLKKEIRLKNISFSYNESTKVIEGISLNIPKGNMVSLVGGSGAGKSTLIDLILGLNEIDSGEIQIDGIPLNFYDLETYRKKIGYVPQDPMLFNQSIKENLLWAKPDASEEDIWLACDKAHATEFIKDLPQGLNSVVGDRGVRFSGGQGQRLALARALIRNPEIIILDEATSALDSHSEKMIQKAIEEISGETTVVVIAHRLSTIKNSDMIYVFNKGNLMEQGNYTELMNNKGYFNSMVLKQSLNE